MSKIGRQLGERIYELRKMRQYTQEELAQKAGISLSYLSMIERAQRTPYVETLVPIAAALGITLSQLFLDLNGPRGSDGQAQDLPLLAYLRTLRVDRTDVDALLRVAKAMFSGRS
jgi:transcriptional regulator with XRE-family HTH domain